MSDTYHHTKVPDIGRVRPTSLEHNLRSSVSVRLNVVVGLLHDIAADSKTKVGDLDKVDIPLHATKVGARLINRTAISFKAGRRVRLLTGDIVGQNIVALKGNHEVVALEVSVNDIGLGVEEVKTLEDAGQDLLDLAGRQAAIVAALLAQHPEGLAEGLKGHTEMLPIGPLDLEGVKHIADVVSASVGGLDGEDMVGDLEFSAGGSLDGRGVVGDLQGEVTLILPGSPAHLISTGHYDRHQFYSETYHEATRASQTVDPEPQPSLETSSYLPANLSPISAG